MKKLGKLILVGALALGTLQAKELFNLKAQDFEYSLNKNQINAKYKVNDVIVETNLIKGKKYSPGLYIGTGYLNIESINALNNWTLNIDFKVSFWNNSQSPRLFKLVSEKGESFILEFFKGGFNINGKKYKAKIENDLLSISINKITESFILKLNNQTLLNEKISFSKLKYIDTNIYYGSYDEKQHDTLNNIILVSHD